MNLLISQIHLFCCSRTMSYAQSLEDKSRVIKAIHYSLENYSWNETIDSSNRICEMAAETGNVQVLQLMSTKNPLAVTASLTIGMCILIVHCIKRIYCLLFTAAKRGQIEVLKWYKEVIVEPFNNEKLILEAKSAGNEITLVDRCRITLSLLLLLISFVIINAHTHSVINSGQDAVVSYLQLSIWINVLSWPWRATRFAI